MNRTVKKINAMVTEVIEKYEEPLLRYVIGIVKNSEQAKDIVQDSFIRYVKYLNEEKEDIENVKAWLYKISHNRALDYLRTQTRRRKIRENSIESISKGKITSPDKQLDLKDIEQIVNQEINALEPREKEIVLLKIREEKSYKEIAEQMNLTVSNVGFILHSVLKKMAIVIKEKIM